jgi:hypothetical protein
MDFPRVSRWYRCLKVIQGRGVVSYKRLVYLQQLKEVKEKQTGFRHVIQTSKRGLMALFVCQQSLTLDLPKEKCR